MLRIRGDTLPGARGTATEALAVAALGTVFVATCDAHAALGQTQPFLLARSALAAAFSHGGADIAALLAVALLGAARALSAAGIRLGDTAPRMGGAQPVLGARLPPRAMLSSTQRRIELRTVHARRASARAQLRSLQIHVCKFFGERLGLRASAGHGGPGSYRRRAGCHAPVG